MKDKLVRTGVKRNYYVKRRLVIIAAVLAVAGASIAIPVGVRAYNATHSAIVITK